MRYFSALAVLFLYMACLTDRHKLEDKEKTIELQYIAWACDCPNWATVKDIEKYSSDDGDQLAGLCIFVEAADSSLELPGKMNYNDSKVKFTGRFYKEKGFPVNYTSIENPDKARVFRYTSYKIVGKQRK